VTVPVPRHQSISGRGRIRLLPRWVHLRSEPVHSALPAHTDVRLDVRFARKGRWLLPGNETTRRTNGGSDIWQGTVRRLETKLTPRVQPGELWFRAEDEVGTLSDVGRTATAMCFGIADATSATTAKKVIGGQIRHRWQRERWHSRLHHMDFRLLE
jgi:hypothetical protein